MNDAINLTNLKYPGSFLDVSLQYDSRNRRRLGQNLAHSTGRVLASEIRYPYNRMRALQDRDRNDNPQVTYALGPEPNGSFSACRRQWQTAGPIFGLRLYLCNYSREGMRIRG